MLAYINENILWKFFGCNEDEHEKIIGELLTIEGKDIKSENLKEIKLKISDNIGDYYPDSGLISDNYQIKENDSVIASALDKQDGIIILTANTYYEDEDEDIYISKSQKENVDIISAIRVKRYLYNGIVYLIKIKKLEKNSTIPIYYKKSGCKKLKNHDVIYTYTNINSKLKEYFVETDLRTYIPISDKYISLSEIY